MPDFTRSTFTQAVAPRDQRCACKCGLWIRKGDSVYARRQTGRGQGTTRIIDLGDHYRAWLEHVARQYASAQAASDPAFRRYLGGR